MVGGFSPSENLEKSAGFIEASPCDLHHIFIVTMTTAVVVHQMYIFQCDQEQNAQEADMNTLQITTPRTLTIHTTLFEILAAMQEDAIESQMDVHSTDEQIVATVAEWMQSGRITAYASNPIRSAA
jgi:hypothetical protein